ncbi:MULTISPECIES: flagellar transcriptional regulator FlhD [Halomonadaceae]|jgi:flagellar transcriptional activator FlhD|uniref:Flagellar transcriptional regulator FlhD n=2 Tax=Vreelandella TaxID=3137766 RepID=A0A0D7UWX5_9GAMM|nr:MULTISPECIES: flagellar transcriptional regulator FlhD [Halomonas]KTG27852.1 transcriptional regulator [Idiomarina sp. H105]MEC7294775.1 flagellar transcriptional regulator FlhD [Pseudomonadota bacterium]OAF06339.1 transcriptional regulator [Idiomarina sp. WRN-38]KJD19125.1 transcriptional regulator [Halomonas meridiana]MBV64762.1 flagellar transcriptional regulator FlhD [Halomonas sp.]|tara:strand:- start:345 stop:677 length:333 start_codon:yes stop_codon:yes gene_type:complete
MSQTSFLDEIQEINLAYLLLAQRLLSEDREAAMFRLKIDSELADLLVSLNAWQLTKLARSNQLVCRFSHSSGRRLREILENPRDQGLSGLHASLLSACEPLESLSSGESE